MKDLTDHRLTRRSYDDVATRYDEAIGDELVAKPLDRALLASLAEQCSGGVVGDLGCGPGHVAAHLATLGAHVVGVDLSPQMCVLASRRGVPAVSGDLVGLPLADGSLSGVVCWYTLIHLDPAERAIAYHELARVLRPAGCGLIAFHTADADARPGDSRHLASWWDGPVDLTFRFLDADAEIHAAECAGLRLSARLDRQPVEGEHQSARSYLFLRAQ